MSDNGLRNLLELNGETIALDGCYFVKFDVKEVEATANRPHGISYSLTLHDVDNKRMLGFDNAHAVRQPSKGFRGKRYEFDHKHRHAKDKGVPYVFESPEQLVDDFWKAVYEFMGWEP